MTAFSLAERVGKVFEVLVHHRVYADQARVKMFRKHYSQIPMAYLLIKEFLTHNGMYAPLSRSYLNYSASRCYKIYNILTKDEKESFWNMLHSEYAEKLGWIGKEAEDFDENEVCEFIASIILYEHEQYSRRLEKGHKLNLDNLKAKYKNAKFRKRFWHFFKKITLIKEKKTEESGK
jgi:hypothetical protein